MSKFKPSTPKRVFASIHFSNPRQNSGKWPPPLEETPPHKPLQYAWYSIFILRKCRTVWRFSYRMRNISRILMFKFECIERKRNFVYIHFHFCCVFTRFSDRHFFTFNERVKMNFENPPYSAYFLMIYVFSSDMVTNMGHSSFFCIIFLEL